MIITIIGITFLNKWPCNHLFHLLRPLSIHSLMANWTEYFSVQLIMMCWDDVWTWQHIVGNNSRDLFTGSAFSPLTLTKLIHFLWFKLQKKIGRKLCQTQCTWEHTLVLKSKQMDELVLTHTWNQCCFCKKTANVKRQTWITLIAQLTVVFNIMISNPSEIDYISSSLFTWRKNILSFSPAGYT